MASLSILVRLLLWRRLWADRAGAALTAFGIALGVAVYLAIRMANGAVLDSFNRSLDAVAGRTTLTLSRPDPGFDETILPAVRAQAGVDHAAAVIQVLAPVAGLRGEVLLVLGVDTLSETSFREYQFLSGAEAGDSLAILTDPDAILLTRPFAERHGLREGSRIGLAAGAGVRPFTVRGLLDFRGTAQALDGNIALLDIANAQLAFGRIGRLDRIDIITTPGADIEEVAAALRRMVPPGISVDRPSQRNRQVERMLASFQLNLHALSLIALFVGLFLVFNTVATSVVRQRREIGILKSLGFRRGHVMALVAGQALLLGLLGSALGLLLALALARTTVLALAQTVSSLYAYVRPGGVHIRPWMVVEALGLGGGVSLLAALVPAREAARIPIREAVGVGSWEAARRPGLAAAAGLASLAAAYFLSLLGPVGGAPLFGYAAALAIAVGVSLMAPAAVLALAGALRPLLRRGGRLSPFLGVLNLARGVRRNGVTVAAMMIGLAMLVSVTTMIKSFRGTVEVWVEQTIRADLIVSSAARLAKGVEARFPAPFLSTLKGMEGVVAVDAFRAVRMEDGRGGRYLLGAGDFEVLSRFGRVLFMGGDSAETVRRARERGELIVSETFSLRYGLGVGDAVEIPSPSGPARLRVAGVFYDYTTDGGLAVMDRALFVRLWGDDSVNSLAVYLAPGADPRAVRQRILERFGARSDLIVFTNRGLKDHILKVFDQTFAITYALEAIAIVVAALGILNTLLAAILERRREIGILRSIGFTRGRILEGTLAEAGLMGLLADGLAAAGGLLLSLVLVFVINKQSFGWSIQFRYPLAAIIGYAVVALMACLAAGYIPARRAARTEIADAIRYQ